MARPGITYAQVAKAADEITENGKGVTVDSVREALGDTGSKSTIGPLVKRWKAEHEANPTVAPGLPAHLAQAVAALNERMQADADSRIDTLSATHELVIDEMRDQLALVQMEAADLSRKRGALAMELAEARERQEAFSRETQALQLSNTKATAEIAGLTARLTDRAAEINALQEHQAKARQQFEHFQDSVATQRAEERQQNVQQISRLEQELTATRQALSAQQLRSMQLDSLLSNANQMEQTLRAELSDLRKMHAAGVDEQQRLGRELVTTSDRSNTLETRLDQVAATLLESKTALAIAVHAQSDLTARLAVTEKKLGESEAEHRLLLRDYSLLQGQLGAQTLVGADGGTGDKQSRSS